MNLKLSHSIQNLLATLTGRAAKVADRIEVEVARIDSDYLRCTRREAGLTQKEVATILGMSSRMYQYYELGEREDGRLVEIPKTVKIAIAHLYLVHRHVLIEELPSQNSDPSSTSGKT